MGIPVYPSFITKNVCFYGKINKTIGLVVISVVKILTGVTCTFTKNISSSLFYIKSLPFSPAMTQFIFCQRFNHSKVLKLWDYLWIPFIYYLLNLTIHFCLYIDLLSHFFSVFLIIQYQAYIHPALDILAGVSWCICAKHLGKFCWTRASAPGIWKIPQTFVCGFHWFVDKPAVGLIVILL